MRLHLSSLLRGLTALKESHALDKQEIGNKTVETSNLIQKQQFLIFTKICQWNINLRQKVEKAKETSLKSEKLMVKVSQTDS
jgi:hypothetical protein